MTQAQEAVESGKTFLPEMNAVESSNINSIGYDGSNAFVEFKDGTYWMYTDVPASVYTDWLKSESIGSYFHAKIKGSYNSAKWVDNEWALQHEAGNDSESESTTDTAPSDIDETVRSDSGESHPMEQEAQEQAAKENESAAGNDATDTPAAPNGTDGEAGNPVTPEEGQEGSAPEAPEEPTAAGEQADSMDVVAWGYGEDTGLRVTMGNGEQLHYPDAPEALMQGLSQAGNPTKYYQAQIVPHYEGKPAA